MADGLKLLLDAARKSERVHKNLPDDVKEILLCGVCLNQQIIGVIYNTMCCHRSLCAKCYNQLPNLRCPYCRTERFVIIRNKMADKILMTYGDTTVIPHSKMFVDISERKNAVEYRNTITEGEIGLLYYKSSIRNGLCHFGLVDCCGYNLIRRGDCYQSITKYGTLKLESVPDLRIRLTKLTLPELVNVYTTICDTILYLYSKDIYGIDLCISNIQLSEDLMDVKINPIIQRLPKFNLLERNQKIRRREKEDIADLLDLISISGHHVKFRGDTIEEVRRELFDLLDRDKFTECEIMTRDCTDRHQDPRRYLVGFQVPLKFDPQAHSVKYVECNSTMRCCRKCNTWDVILRYRKNSDNCELCGCDHNGTTDFIIVELGLIRFTKDKKIHELIKSISILVQCNPAAISLLDDNGKNISVDETVFHTVGWITEQMKLVVNYRLA